MKKCDGKNHNLVVVHSSKHSPYDEWAVVRWCKFCGAVAVDIDVDNRTHPGEIRQMKFPDIAYEYSKLLKNETNPKI